MRFSPIGKKIRLACVVLTMVLIQLAPAGADNFAKLRHYGYIEWAVLSEGNIRLKAKLDTGADNSSVHAPGYEFFQNKGKEWVRFTVQGENGEIAEFEKPLVRKVTIQHRTGPNATRPVVKMNLCVGDRKESVEVNLSDRTGLQYPLLIGRSFLEKGILVNSAAQYTTQPRCDEKTDL